MRQLFIWITLLFAGLVPVCGQSDNGIILTIIGSTEYIERTSDIAVNLIFAPDPTYSASEKFADFKKYIADEKVDTTAFLSLTENVLSKQDVLKVRFITNDETQLLKVTALANTLRTPMEKIYYWFPPYRWEDEDDRAVAALDDAIQKAEVIAKHLGKEVVDVLNIDDKTKGYEYYFIGMETEKQELLGDLFDQLSEIQFNTSQDSEEPERRGRYMLKVTFELRN